MRKKKPTVVRRRPPGVRALEARLQVAEEALQAIRSGDVDALVVKQAMGEHVIRLAGAELSHDLLFDQMHEGAVTLTQDGVVTYCNRRFAEIVRSPIGRVIGTPLGQFVAPADAPHVEQLRRGGNDGSARDLVFRATDGTSVPVAVSFAPLRPAGRGGDPIGVVGVIRDITDRKHAERELARLVGLLMTAQEEERRRIARELHDEIGQSLTALLVGLRTIEGVATIQESTELAIALRETTARTLVDVGRLWRGLHPGVLDELGLTAAVVRHAQEFAQTRGIPVDVQTDGIDDLPLPAIVQVTAYRVVQEALHNVAQHAQARTASVRLRQSALSIEIRVQDDGTGIRSRDVGRLGLRGMRERAQLLGGSIAVKSRAGKGTTLIARFPVRAD